MTAGYREARLWDRISATTDDRPIVHCPFCRRVFGDDLALSLHRRIDHKGALCPVDADPDDAIGLTFAAPIADGEYTCTLPDLHDGPHLRADGLWWLP